MKKKGFQYYFFEVKSTLANFSSAIIEINKWYTQEIFTERYLLEYNLIKDRVNSSLIQDTDKKTIDNDLESLARSLVNEEIPEEKYHFCGFILTEMFNKQNIAAFNKAEMFRNGFDAILEVKNLKKIIKEAYLCLGITLKGK